MNFVDKADNVILFRKTHSYTYKENVIEIQVIYSKIGIHWFSIHTIRNRFSDVMWLVIIFHQNCKYFIVIATFQLQLFNLNVWISLFPSLISYVTRKTQNNCNLGLKLMQ